MENIEVGNRGKEKGNMAKNAVHTGKEIDSEKKW